MVVLMLLVFVGQGTVASALPCQMDMQQGLSQMDHSSNMMDHSSHMMPDQAEKSPKDDCCSKNNGCSMSGCTSLALLTFYHSLKVLFAPESIEYQTQLNINQFPTSLYRPPILA